MKPEQITEALETAAAQIGIKVRYETLPPGGVLSGGGLCRIRGDWNLIVDRKATPSERAAILTDALADFDTDSVFLPPQLRDMVQARRTSKGAGSQSGAA